MEWIETKQLNDHLQANKALQTALSRLILAVEENKDTFWSYIKTGEMYQGPDCDSPVGCVSCIEDEILELEQGGIL